MVFSVARPDSLYRPLATSSWCASQCCHRSTLIGDYIQYNTPLSLPLESIEFNTLILNRHSQLIPGEGSGEYYIEYNHLWELSGDNTDSHTNSRSLTAYKVNQDAQHWKPSTRGRHRINVASQFHFCSESSTSSGHSSENSHLNFWPKWSL
jgi:hypothetical protein